MEGTRNNQLKQVVDYIENQREAYRKEFGGIEFTVLPGSYISSVRHALPALLRKLPPANGNDVKIQNNKCKKSADKIDFLDVGCGTGCSTVVYYLNNKDKINRILATDIVPACLENAKLTFEEFNIPNAEVRYSDVFSSIKNGEKFDVIFWNPPLGWLNEKMTVNMTTALIADPGYVALGRYLEEVHKYLKPNGRAFIHFSRSTDFGNADALKEVARKRGKSLNILFKESETHAITGQLIESQLIEILDF